MACACACACACTCACSYGPSSQFHSTATSFRRGYTYRTVLQSKSACTSYGTALDSATATLYRRFEVSRVPAPARTNNSLTVQSVTNSQRTPVSRVITTGSQINLSLPELAESRDYSKIADSFRHSLRPHKDTTQLWTHTRFTVKRTVQVCTALPYVHRATVTLVCVLYRLRL